MANLMYNAGKKKLLDGSIDWLTETIKVALVTSGYSPNQDTHDFFDDVTNEVVGAGYTAGGATLAGKAVTQDDTNNRGVCDADDVTWAAATITARGAVVYKSTGVASTSPLICYIDFGADKTSSGGDLKIEWNAAGVVYVGDAA